MSDKNPANKDPISGAPGAHPVGTGLGAAGAHRLSLIHI